MTLVGLACLGAMLLTACSDPKKEERPAPVPSISTSSAVSATNESISSTSTSLAPVPKVLDSTSVQDGVRRVLTESYQLAGVESVTCPPNQPVTVGYAFDCAASVGGKEQQVTITVKTEQGEYEVGVPK